MISAHLAILQNADFGEPWTLVQEQRTDRIITRLTPDTIVHNDRSHRGRTAVAIDDAGSEPLFDLRCGTGFSVVATAECAAHVPFAGSALAYLNAEIANDSRIADGCSVAVGSVKTDHGSLLFGYSL